MPFDIFIIGPMAKKGDAVVPSTHTGIIKQAVLDIIAAHGLADVVTVTAPDDLGGSVIASDVFSRLDAAELVIADLSQRSPNVLYELAFADALGLPTLLVCDDKTDVPFYFLPRRVQRVPRITRKAVTKAIADPLVAAVGASGGHDIFSNPLRDFYEAPVVDISAAAGLAVGYYFNFVHDIIKNQGILDANPGRVSALLIVVASTLSNHAADRVAIEARVAELVGREVRDDQLQRALGTRPFTVKVVDGLIFDVPSAPYALGHSPRVRQLRQRLNRPGVSPDARTVPVTRMTRSLLATFVRELQSQIDGDHNTRADRVLIATTDTMPGVLSRARAARYLQ
jgi:hypothetical protein